jgi:ssDNA-binding Zn-finger/Zn-ribbon topoisomerase 1
MMRLRTAKAGSHAGNQFWGCAKYPECSKILAFDPPDGADNADDADPNQR